MDHILNRVKKMLNLAKDAAATEGERDNALRMAYATLAKHNLTMAQVEIGESVEARTSQQFQIRHQMWQVNINHAVAKLFFCNLFITKRKPYIVMTYVGKESNIATAKEMANWLIESILVEGKSRSLDPQWIASFNKGAASTLFNRCEQLREQAEQEEKVAQPTATGTALVLASLYKTETQANDDFIANQMGIKLGASKSRKSSIDYDAYAQGSSFGSKLNLNKQIGGHADTKNRLTAQ
jgi:hypothetical protein